MICMLIVLTLLIAVLLTAFSCEKKDNFALVYDKKYIYSSDINKDTEVSIGHTFYSRYYIIRNDGTIVYHYEWTYMNVTGKNPKRKK